MANHLPPTDPTDAGAWKRWLDAVFAGNPGRRRHLELAHTTALLLCGGVAGEDAPVLGRAALLHDIGRTVDLPDTVPHALSGAFMLREAGLERESRLVAHHSGADLDATLRGCGPMVVGWPRDDPDLEAVLTWIDAVSGPDGEHVSPAERLAGIEARYGAGSREARVFASHACQIEHGARLARIWSRGLVG